MEIQHIYSFTAAYEDGTIIHHNHKEKDGDKSLQFEDKSKFTDVLEKEKESKLISFVLHNDTMSAGVDLRDGHFELNGISFFQHRPDMEPYKDFRIIYFRTVSHTISQTTGETLSSDIRQYALGWQVTHNGKNVKKTIFI